MTFTATAAYPYEDLERATAGLRAALRQQLLAAGIRGLQVWDTFVVTGPVECADRLGRTWYEYRATVDSWRPHTTDLTRPVDDVRLVGEGPPRTCFPD